MNYHSKYRSVKTEVDGITFDSKKEAKRYLQLRQMQEQGIIKNLQTQVEFELIPSAYEDIKQYSKVTGAEIKPKRKLIERKCSYIADFVYETADETVVEDTKGLRTPDYIIKRKLMLYIHKIKIKEI